MMATIRGKMWRRNKPGWAPPDRLLRKMKRLHPRISLQWSTAFGKWGLIERTLAGTFELVAVLEGRPTEANTIRLLNRCCMARLQEQGRLDAFIQELDDSQAAAEAIPSLFSERIGEGSDRMFNLVRNSHVVAFGGRRGSRRRKKGRR